MKGEGWVQRKLLCASGKHIVAFVRMVRLSLRGMIPLCYEKTDGLRQLDITESFLSEFREYSTLSTEFSTGFPASIAYRRVELWKKEDVSPALCR